MVDAGPGSLRFSRSDQERLFVALVVSLLFHLVIWSGYEAGRHYGWWHALHQLAQRHHPAPKPATPPPDSQPTIFVEVTQPDATPPKHTMYYSDQNSHAGNPDKDLDANRPQLNGHQTVVPKTEDAARLSKAQPPAPQPQPLQPSPEPPPAPVAASEASPLNAGDLKPKKLAQKAETQPDAPPTPPRPRTLRQAAAQNHLPGPEMHQNGGAHHRLISSFDARATPFGDYDRAVIYAVTERWYGLLDQQNFAQDRTGTVVVRFQLEYDGTVRNVEVLENHVGDVLSYVCQSAIEEAAPFGKWPDDMRRAIGANYRDITFTFDYY